MKKKLLQQIALTCIVFYFLFDAVQKLLSNSRDVYRFTFNHKIGQIESCLENNNLLFFEFSMFIEQISTPIIVTLGVVELISAAMIYFHDEKE